MSGNGNQTIELPLTFLVKQEGQEWSALCLELDIASDGSSEAEVIASLKGLVDLYVTDCVADGEVPIPMRYVPLEAIRKFLTPPGERTDIPVTSHREYIAIHAHG
jgi:predicted RNase H-like HicB family nuclease